jgi:hypothetical protein
VTLPADPVAAWLVHAAAVQRLLDGSEAATPVRHPRVGEVPLPDAVDRSGPLRRGRP